MRLIHPFKRSLLILALTLMTSMTYAADNAGSLAQIAANTESSGDTLKKIAKNTLGTWVTLNTIPEKLFFFIENWVTPDMDPENPSASVISQMQGSFASLGNTFTQNINQQLDLQPALLASALNVNVKAFLFPPNAPSITENLPEINDLAYASLLGKPPVKKAPFKPENYISYAAGLNIHHVIPNPDWEGKDKDKLQYKNYFYTNTAIQSFNAYVLSNLLAEEKNGNPQLTLQNTLISQASAPDWLAKIATEALGKLLRHILLYTSQSYVLQSEMLKIQKEQLTAQIMTNTLLMSNTATEPMMLSRAKGTRIQDEQ